MTSKVRDPRIPQVSLRGGAGTHGDRRMKRHDPRPRSRDLIEDALAEHEDEVMSEAARQVAQAATQIDSHLRGLEDEDCLRASVRGVLRDLEEEFRNGPKEEVGS